MLGGQSLAVRHPPSRPGHSAAGVRPGDSSRRRAKACAASSRPRVQVQQGQQGQQQGQQEEGGWYRYGSGACPRLQPRIDAPCPRALCLFMLHLALCSLRECIPLLAFSSHPLGSSELQQHQQYDQPQLLGQQRSSSEVTPASVHQPTPTSQPTGPPSLCSPDALLPPYQAGMVSVTFELPYKVRGTR